MQLTKLQRGIEAGVKRDDARHPLPTFTLRGRKKGFGRGGKKVGRLASDLGMNHLMNN